MKINYILFLIIAIGFLFRFYMLGEVPAGLVSDEANTGYDAYSILHTGKDQWGTSYPLVSFKGFGDNRSPIYTYLVVPFIWLFDLSPIAVRLPSAIAGVFSIVFIYLLSKKLFGNKVGLVAAALLSVSPWAVALSRQGIESNLALAFLISGIYFFQKIKESSSYFLIAMLLFFLTVYTYTSYVLFTPIVLFVLSYTHRKYILKFKKSSILVFTIFIIGSLPLFIFSSAGNTRFSQIGFLGDITSLGLIDVLNQKLGGCYDVYPELICRIFNNKISTFTSIFFQNYLHHFSFDFLYIKGTTTQLSLLYERGLLYLYEASLLLLGIYILIKKRKNYFILSLLLISAIPDSLSGGGHHSRASSMLPFLIIIQSIGMVILLDYLKSFKKRLASYLVILMLVLLISYSVMSFAINYFGYFKKHYSSYSLYAYQELSEELKFFKNSYSNIYISSYRNDAPAHIFYLFYNKYDPVLYQSKKDIEYEVEENGFVKVKRIENIQFTNFRLTNSLTEFSVGTRPALLIASPDAFPKQTKSIRQFKDLTGGIIFQAVEYNELE